MWDGGRNNQQPLSARKPQLQTLARGTLPLFIDKLVRMRGWGRVAEEERDLYTNDT